MRFFLLSTPFFAITKIKKYTFFINLQKTIKISLKILKGSTDLPFTGVCVGTMKQFKAVYFTFAILGFSLLLFPTIKGSYATTEQNHLGTAIQEVNTQNKEKVDSAVKKIDKQRRFMLLGAIANGAMGAYFLNKQCNPRSDPVEAPDETKKKEFAEARDKAQGGRESAVAEAQTQPAAEAQTQPVAEAQSQPVAEAQSQATASGTGPDGSITKTPADQPSGFAANQPTPTPAGTAQGGGLSGAIDTTGPGSWGTTPPAGYSTRRRTFRSYRYNRPRFLGNYSSSRYSTRRRTFRSYRYNRPRFLGNYSSSRYSTRRRTFRSYRYNRPRFLGNYSSSRYSTRRRTFRSYRYNRPRFLGNYSSSRYSTRRRTFRSYRYNRPRFLGNYSSSRYSTRRRTFRSYRYNRPRFLGNYSKTSG